ERARPLPTRRPRRDRHRRLVRARRRLRPGAGRGRCRRGARRPAYRPARGDQGARGGGRSPRGHRGHRRRQARGLPGPRRRCDGRARPGGHPRQQRRHRHRRPGHPGVPGAVQAGDRREPQRLLLDGAGLRARDAAGQQHHQHLLGARPHDRGSPPGRVRRLQGRAHRADPGPREPVDRSQGDPGQRRRARLLHQRDDRPVPRGLFGVPARQDPGGPQGRPGGAQRGGGLPRLGRRRLRHRADHRGRRGHDDHL
ncbi:MAG: 3-oxoacyl-[acyl-carrier protein] reductase, partial [uncultured Nocardioidaceae bacterium]